MSSDIKELMSAVDRQDSRSQPPKPGAPADEPAAAGMKLPPLPEQSGMQSAPDLKPVPALPPLPDTMSPGESREGADAASAEGVREFFERNASMPGMVTLPSGVQYRIVRQGDGRSPEMGDWVVVDYLGMTPDGNIFDNTYDSGQRATFGMDGLLPGWQEPLLRMQEGSEFEIYVPPDIANIGGIPSDRKQAGQPGIYLVELRQVIPVGEGD
jgi:hypothetical protein